MSQDRSVEVLQEMEQAIARAQEVLTAAQDARTQNGLGSQEEALARLESQLSPEDIALVDAQVAEEVARIEDEIKARQMHSGNTASASASAPRRKRQMV